MQISSIALSSAPTSPRNLLDRVLDGGTMTGKPLGIDIALRDGIPCFVVSPLDRVADTIWDAVREAINANMLPEQFKREVANAWDWHLKEDAKYAVKELTK